MEKAVRYSWMQRKNSWCPEKGYGEPKVQRGLRRVVASSTIGAYRPLPIDTGASETNGACTSQMKKTFSETIHEVTKTLNIQLSTQRKKEIGLRGYLLLDDKYMYCVSYDSTENKLITVKIMKSQRSTQSIEREAQDIFQLKSEAVQITVEDYEVIDDVDKALSTRLKRKKSKKNKKTLV